MPCFSRISAAPPTPRLRQLYLADDLGFNSVGPNWISLATRIVTVADIFALRRTAPIAAR